MNIVINKRRRDCPYIRIDHAITYPLDAMFDGTFYFLWSFVLNSFNWIQTPFGDCSIVKPCYSMGKTTIMQCHGYLVSVWPNFFLLGQTLLRDRSLKKRSFFNEQI